MIINVRQNKGITLIALVITIIVLLILAGVAIASLTGDNGLLSRAVDAKQDTEKSQIIEEARIAMQVAITDKRGEKLTREEVIDILKEYFNNVPSDITDQTQSITTKTNGYSVKLSEVIKDIDIVSEESLDLISFSINGKSYEGESGMKWEDWISSKYNTSFKEYTLDEWTNVYSQEYGGNGEYAAPTKKTSDLRSLGVTRVVNGIFIISTDNSVMDSGITFLNDSGEVVDYEGYVPYGFSGQYHTWYLKYNGDLQFSNMELMDGATYENYYND